MAGLAAATSDASFRCNGCVAVSPGASPPVLQRRPARRNSIRLVPVGRGDQHLLSGLGLLTLTLLAPEITVPWPPLMHYRARNPLMLAPILGPEMGQEVPQMSPKLVSKVGSHIRRPSAAHTDRI